MSAEVGLKWASGLLASGVSEGLGSVSSSEKVDLHDIVFCKVLFLCRFLAGGVCIS